MRTYEMNQSDVTREANLRPGSKWHRAEPGYLHGNVTIQRVQGGYVRFDLPGHGDEEIPIVDFWNYYEPGHTPCDCNTCRMTGPLKTTG